MTGLCQQALLTCWKQPTPNEKVRELQRQLWACAKRSKTRRFHALYDRIHRSDVLWEAVWNVVLPAIVPSDFIRMAMNSNGLTASLKAPWIGSNRHLVRSVITGDSAARACIAVLRTTSARSDYDDTQKLRVTLPLKA